MSRFSYQGACDLVFVRNNLVEIQIRTAFGRNEYFSFVSNVAISIGDDILEIFSNRTYLINGIQQLNRPPATFGGFYPVTIGSDKSFIQISLSGGQKIKMSFYMDTITLEIAAHISDFGDSVGLMGSYSNFDFPYRDGRVRFPANSISQNISYYANEWSVSASKGDKSLFVIPPQREGCKEASPFQSNASLLQRAIAACSALPDDGTRQNCIFDITATGDTNWAVNPGYTNPLQPPREQCVDGKSNECALAGGKCRWRCNGSQFTCLPGICTGIDEFLTVFETNEAGRERAEIGGCSCAIPIPTSQRPSTKTPTSLPTQKNCLNTTSGYADAACCGYGPDLEGCLDANCNALFCCILPNIQCHSYSLTAALPKTNCGCTASTCPVCGSAECITKDYPTCESRPLF